MKSQPILNNSGFTQGFTLIEVVVVMTLVAILGGLGLLFGLDHLRNNSFRSDRDILISALQHARGESITNICNGLCPDGDGKPHGVYIDEENNKFVIFQGSTYDPSDENNVGLDSNKNITHEVNDVIIFNQLSGDVDTCTIACEIKLKDKTTGKISTVSVNSEGQISWEN